MEAMIRTEYAHFGQFSAKVYNALPDVSGAHERFVSEPAIDDFFQRAGRLLCEFGLQEDIGICLLYKHNRVGLEELMVEALEVAEPGRDALVTERAHYDASMDYFPVVWQWVEDVHGHEFVPLEYSILSEARESYHRLLEQSVFLERISDLIGEYGYKDLLGLTVLRSKVLPKRASECLIEKRHETRVAKVVTAQLCDDVARGGMIQTRWSFRGQAVRVANGSEECRTRVSCELLCEPRNSDYSKIHWAKTQIW